MKIMQNPPCKRIERIPVVTPPWEDLPWAVAFTTLAFRNGEGLSCAKEGCKAMRGEVAAATGCAHLQWLGVLHGPEVTEVPPGEQTEAPCTAARMRMAGMGADDRGRKGTGEPGAGTACTGEPGAGIADADCADAAVIRMPNYAAAITTADCLPVIIVDPCFREIAVAHAGWRGLVAGVLENTLRRLSAGKDKETIFAFRAWIGPSIGADYEIGAEVRDAMLESPHISAASIRKTSECRYRADLPDMARTKLVAGGINPLHIEIFPGSVKNNSDFFSVRRDGQETGRMATVAGILPDQEV